MKWLVNGFMQFERGKKFVHQENPKNPNPNVPKMLFLSSLLLF